ncbi:MAG: YkgJ family cysteine cluster protein [Candidatus Bathyarchaeota archaeon]|nr:YkgJ family cysteine cluster protein [Candidatus Bathyarchaeota archaeon]
MLFVPWQYVADWKCRACGLCCKAYSVVVSFQEWLQIVKNYGVEATVSGLGKLYLRKKSDGSCMFLYNLSNMNLCGLQHMKPEACKLWPFKVLANPKYGYANEALYVLGGRRFFVYVDSNCHGIIYGRPTWEFAAHTVREFIEIAMGTRKEQYKSTANIGTPQPIIPFETYNVIRRPQLFY